jgi:hypothetical protein
MTKQQTIELLQKQLPGFYSAEQVIEMIKGIEDTSANLSSGLIRKLCEAITSRIEDNVENVSSRDVIDRSTAEFSLNGNEIELEEVELDVRAIAEEAVYGIAEEIEEFFDNEVNEQETLEVPNS